MATFGIIFCAYNTADLLPISLPPWIAARRTSLGGHQFKICAVCCPFEGFNHEDSVDNTLEVLHTYLARGEIDHIVASSVPVSEVKARGEALKWLVDNGVNILWQADSDEEITETNILSIAHYVEAQPFVSCFRLSLQNLVFDTKHALAVPFTPMRLHRKWHGNLEIGEFYEDNNVFYTDGYGKGTVVFRDTQLPVVTVPSGVAFIRHYSWLSNARSKRKIAYQLARWPACSFRWDETTDTLQFNPAYYAARGEPLPEVFSLDTTP